MTSSLTPGGDALAPESVVRLEVADAPPVVWTCTPLELRELSVGWLVAEGVATGLDDIRELSIGAGAPSNPVVTCTLSEGAAERLRRTVGSERWPGGWPEGPHAATRPGRSAADLDDAVRRLLHDGERLATLFRDMFERASLRSAVGGVHTGGLVIGGQLVAVVEDVSRHHVVDRLVGRAVLDDVGLPGAVFLLSSRISGTMASKACTAGTAALVSRSIPSQLAAAVAARCGLVLVGRARSENRHIHWPIRP